jgi:DNA-binding XRE family transcriptional regulator
MTGDLPPRLKSTSRGKSVGRTLQQARAQLAATEDFVAAALGLSVEAYRSIEDGTAQLTPSHVIQAAQLFGLKPSALCEDLVDQVASDRQHASAHVIDLAAVRLRRKV